MNAINIIRKGIVLETITGISDEADAMTQGTAGIARNMTGIDDDQISWDWAD